MDTPMRLQCAWWRAEAVCWWLHGFRLNLRRDGLATRRATKENEARIFREAVKALVLLGTLARVDLEASLKAISEAWRRDVRDFETKTSQPVTQWLDVGFAYTVKAPEDITILLERLVCGEPPSALCVNDYKWLKTALSTLGADGLSKLPTRAIPLRLLIHLARGSVGDLASVLRQVLQHVSATVSATVSRTRLSVEDDDALAAAVVASFEIVQIDLEMTRIDAESLACLAGLKRLGIHVPSLTSLHVEDPSATNTLAVTSALHTLFPPECMAARATMQSQTTKVSIKDTTTSHYLPAIFSAIHASQDIQTVRLDLVANPSNLQNRYSCSIQDYPEPGATRTLWRWAAYTLFSRHANQHVQKRVVNMDYVDQMLGEIARVLHADNPLAELFETTYKSDDQWMSATRFYVLDPSTHSSDDTNSVLFVSPSRLLVHVIDYRENNHGKWWRVLLPGRGPAWVKDDDALLEPAQRDASKLDGSRFRGSLSDIELEHISVRPSSHQIGDAMALLRLLPRGLKSIDLRAREFGRAGEGIDMSDCTTEVLRLFPKLERLKYPHSTKVARLLIFVEAAEPGHACLRSLSLLNTFRPDGPEFLAFLRVLSDMDHPLTRRLEELRLVVGDIDETPTTEFNLVYRRLLEQNRKLYTISLVRAGSVRGDLVDTEEEPIAIRTGPLDIASKLAFVSVLHSEMVCCQLDAGVISVVFEFAASQLVRKVKIDWR